MQIGIRLHDMAPGTLEERVREAGRHQFQCAHLALSKTVKEHSVSNAALTPGYALYLKKLFSSCDVDIAVLGCYLNLAHPDPEAILKITQTYEAHIRFASVLDCSVVGTETGAPNSSYSCEPACHTKEALGIFLRNLEPVVACAESLGVIFAIEPVWNHIVFDSQKALEVLKAIQSPNLQIIFDPVNLLSMENWQDRERVIGKAIEDLSDHIAIIHLKDFIIEDKKIISVAAGTGCMDYREIFSWMRAEKPYIQATLENTVPNNVQETRRKILNMAGNS